MDDKELLTDDELKKFKEIIRKDYGVELTNKQAFGQGSALVSFFEFLVKRRVEK